MLLVVDVLVEELMFSELPLVDVLFRIADVVKYVTFAVMFAVMLTVESRVYSAVLDKIGLEVCASIGFNVTEE